MATSDDDDPLIVADKRTNSAYPVTVFYRYKGQRRQGYIADYNGVRMIQGRHEGPEPIRYFFRGIEVYDTGHRFAVVKLPPVDDVLEQVAPFLNEEWE